MTLGTHNVLVRVLVSVHLSEIMCSVISMHVHVCVAPPIDVGAWLMAETLWCIIIMAPTTLHANHA